MKGQNVGMEGREIQREEGTEGSKGGAEEEIQGGTEEGKNQRKERHRGKELKVHYCHD